VRHADVGPGALGTIAWAGPDRLLFGGEGEAFRLLDRRLRPVRRYAHGLGDPRGMVVRGRTAFGVEEGRLVAARLPRLRPRPLAHLPTTDVGALVPVVGAPPLRARSAAACVRP